MSLYFIGRFFGWTMVNGKFTLDEYVPLPELKVEPFVESAKYKLAREKFFLGKI